MMIEIKSEEAAKLLLARPSTGVLGTPQDLSP